MLMMHKIVLCKINSQEGEQMQSMSNKQTINGNNKQTQGFIVVRSRMTYSTFGNGNGGRCSLLMSDGTPESYNACRESYSACREKKRENGA